MSTEQVVRVSVQAVGLGALAAGSDEIMPSSKKFRRIKREEIPQAFDLDLVTNQDVTYLPGGIERALVDASRNRHHTLRGIAWGLGGGIAVRPHDWLLAKFDGAQSWWLVYASEPQRMILVSEGGGYRSIDRNGFLLVTMDYSEKAPWTQDEEIGEGLVEPEEG